MYALIEPDDDGLYRPCIIKQEQVFLRWEFRGSGTSTPARQREWVGLVNEAAVVGEDEDVQGAGNGPAKDIQGEVAGPAKDG